MSTDRIWDALSSEEETALEGDNKSFRRAWCGYTSGGDRVTVFALKNGPMEMTLLTYGARVGSLTHHGQKRCLELATLAEYESDKSYLGASIGRVTNRIRNATFSLDQSEYKVTTTATHSLHGGDRGYDRQVWGVENVGLDGSGNVQLVFLRTSPSGEMGFPGTLNVKAKYVLHRDGFTVSYEAEALDQTTVVNMTNHTYFTLSDLPDNVLETHTFQTSCQKVLVLDSDLVPTGDLKDVDEAFHEKDGKQPGVLPPDGLDNYFLEPQKAPEEELLVPLAKISHASGRSVQVLSNQPGLQIFTGPVEGDLYLQGIAAEASLPVDALHHPSFAPITLTKGATRIQTTMYKFTERK